jgi:uncharacterized membrane protein
MSKGRLEAFSDGVLAILITIMVLELRPPHDVSVSDLFPLAPVFGAYVLSFAYLGIYWNNHHHLIHTVKHVTGPIMWANLHLLFWLSLFPFATAWVGEHPGSTWPAALYGVVLLCAAFSWLILQRAIVQSGSSLASALGNDLKGKLSPLLYLSGVLCAFWLPWLSELLYATVALIWIVPDRRIERALAQ